MVMFMCQRLLFFRMLKLSQQCALKNCHCNFSRFFVAQSELKVNGCIFRNFVWSVWFVCLFGVSPSLYDSVMTLSGGTLCALLNGALNEETKLYLSLLLSLSPSLSPSLSLSLSLPLSLHLSISPSPYLSLSLSISLTLSLSLSLCPLCVPMYLSVVICLITGFFPPWLKL